MSSRASGGAQSTKNPGLQTRPGWSSCSQSCLGDSAAPNDMNEALVDGRTSNVMGPGRGRAGLRWSRGKGWRGRQRSMCFGAEGSK